MHSAFIVNNPNSIAREELFKYGPIEPVYESIENSQSLSISNFRLDNDKLLFKIQPNEEPSPNRSPKNKNEKEYSPKPAHTTEVTYEKPYNNGGVVPVILTSTINTTKTKHEISPLFQSGDTRERYCEHKVELDKIINSCTLLYNDMSKLYNLQKRNQQFQMTENKKFRLFKIYAYVAVFSGLSFFLDNLLN